MANNIQLDEDMKGQPVFRNTARSSVHSRLSSRIPSLKRHMQNTEIQSCCLYSDKLHLVKDLKCEGKSWQAETQRVQTETTVVNWSKEEYIYNAVFTYLKLTDSTILLHRRYNLNYMKQEKILILYMQHEPMIKFYISVKPSELQIITIF